MVLEGVNAPELVLDVVKARLTVLVALSRGPVLQITRERRVAK